jgi:hypothetical protein
MAAQGLCSETRLKILEYKHRLLAHRAQHGC